MDRVLSKYDHMHMPDSGLSRVRNMLALATAEPFEIK